MCTWGVRKKGGKKRAQPLGTPHLGIHSPVELILPVWQLQGQVARLVELVARDLRERVGDEAGGRLHGVLEVPAGDLLAAVGRSLS